MFGAVGGLASGRVLLASSLLLAVAAVLLVEGYYDVVLVRVGAGTVGLGADSAYVVGLLSSLAALVGVVILYGSRETVLALRFYSGSLARCLGTVVLGSALFGVGVFLLLLVLLASGTGDLHGSVVLVAVGFLDYLVLSLLFYGLTAGLSESRLLASIIVFMRAFTPPLEEAWFASPLLASYFYLSGRVPLLVLSVYLMLYVLLGVVGCRVLAWRG